MACEIYKRSQSDDGQVFTFFDAPATWYDAEANCDKLGGHLATVTSAAEQQQVEDLPVLAMICCKDGGKVMTDFTA